MTRSDVSLDQSVAPRAAAPAPAVPARAMLLGAAGAMFLAFSGIFVRLADVTPVTAAVFRCAYALPVLVPLALRERLREGPRPRRRRAFAAAAGVCFALDLVVWHHAINAVGAGLATVLGNLQVVVVGVLAWAVLGERPARNLIIAVPVMLLGVVLISGVVGAAAYGEDPVLGVVFGLCTSVAYAGYILLLRQGGRSVGGPARPLTEATAVAAVVAAAIGVAGGQLDLAWTWPSHGWLIALALSAQVLAWLLIGRSLPRLPAAVTSVLLMLQPVGAVALGMVLLGEAPSPVQLVGAGIVLAGVIFATAPRRAERPA